MKARVLGDPFLDSGVLVRGVVVTDQMQFFVIGRLQVDAAQEREPLLTVVTLFVRSVMSEPSSVFSAANSVAMPWHLRSPSVCRARSGAPPSPAGPALQ